MPKLSIIVFSGTVDKLYPAAMLTSAAASAGWEVELFFTFWGLVSITKEGLAKSVERFPKDYADHEETMREAMKRANLPPWWDLIRQAKEVGKVRVHACSPTMEMLGLKREDLADFVDDVIGAMTFLELSKDAEVTLFI